MWKTTTLASLVVALTVGMHASLAQEATLVPLPLDKNQRSEQDQKSKPRALIIAGHPDSTLITQGWQRDGYDAVITNAYSKKAFLNEIKQTAEKYGPIDFLFFATHGCNDYLGFTNDWISITDIKQGELEGYDKYFNRRPGYNNCVITSCNTGKKEGSSVAEEFCKALKINGVASKTEEAFTPQLGDMLWPISQVPNIRWKEVQGPNEDGFGTFELQYEGAIFSVSMYTNGNMSSIGCPSGTKKIPSSYDLQTGKIPIPHPQEWHHLEPVTNGVKNLDWPNLRRFNFGEQDK